MMLQAQINDLKKMIALLLEKPKKKPKSSRLGTFPSKLSKSQGKDKEGESSTSETIDGENNFNYENSKFSSKEEKNSEKEVDRHIKRMNELENCLEAIAHRGNLQEVGVVRSYPAEWYIVPSAQVQGTDLATLMVKVPRINIYITSNPKQGM